MSEQLYSEVSSSEDDESAQCSNLQAIAMVENESRRYVTSTLVITTDNINNPFSTLHVNIVSTHLNYPLLIYSL